MGDAGTSVRIVPSGKIYRQMFEAQVQLNRSLTKIARDSDHKSGCRGTDVPIVQLPKDELEHGILGTRQRTWADGFPNDPYVENPVAYKQYAEYVSTQMKEPDSSVAGKEVRGLPDVVAPAKDTSDIIERIAASRKERHEAAVEEMHQELTVINADLEPVIEESSQQLLNRLMDDDQELDRLFAKVETDDDLLSFTLDDLHQLWDEIQGHSQHRQDFITQLDDNLKKAEDDRMEMIHSVFKDYAKSLEKIAYVLLPDLQRFLNKESQLINQTVLSNRRAYGDLYVRLMSSDIEREKNQHLHWKRRLDDWKTLNTELAIKQFSNYMQHEKVVKPPGVQKVMQFMITEQEMLNSKRLELIDHLQNLKPPSSTKTSVYHWNKGVQDVSQEINTSSQLHLSSLHKEYENVCQVALDEIDILKMDLVERGVCSGDQAQSVVEQFMIPIVGDQQRIYEENLETMEKQLEDHAKALNEDLKSLFKYAQGAAHVWDVHEIGLARQERALQEKLEECRQQHDNQNQDKEAHLDIIMDRTRQDASEKALKDSLSKALDMLEKIRGAYEVFHGDQTSIVKGYPMMVHWELTNFDEAVCRFFSVSRKKPHEEGEASGDDAEDGTGEDDGSPDGDAEKKKVPQVKKMYKFKAALMGKESDISNVVSDVLNTAKGTTFYVLTVAGKHGVATDETKTDMNGSDTAFMTEVSQSPDSVKPEYVASIDVPKSVLDSVKHIIRMNFLNHLEEWMDQAAERAQSVVVAKCEEMNSELDLRLHLHKPRSRRAEYDVHNVRAAELVMHSERVTRHCKGIQQALTEVRSRFTAMQASHNSLTSKFREEIEALEVVFINATKASRLYGLKNQLNVELEKFMSVIRASLRQYRQHLDETLQMLRESNARFIKSFKVFSDGGNFCPEEIDEYRKRLDKMSTKIDSSEGSVMADLEGMESKRLEQATKVAMEFEDRFKSHMIDLIFMEKIARWLTNTQVKIKAEVAKSNSQAQQLGQHLVDQERRIDACEWPNLDKEQITSQQLNDSLKVIFEAFHLRSVYLNSMKDQIVRPLSGMMQGAQAVGARVGFVQDTGPTPISKAGKQPVEDPSVGVIKHIMKTQKSNLRFGMDAELDGELVHTGTGEREKMKSSMSTTASSDRGKQSRRGVSPGLASTDGTKKITSGASLDRSRQPPPQEEDERPSISSNYNWMRRLSKPSKFEKKILIFGDNIQEDDEKADTHFLGVIRKTLKDALDGLLSSSELYYRQKGSRTVTRPQALQETFELCADVIVLKLQSYYHQADEYHNQCLQEFRSQLSQLERSVSHIPALVIADLIKDHVQQAERARTDFQAQFAHSQSNLEDKRKEHEHLLRPTLGHPHQVNELSALVQQETDRHTDYDSTVEQHAKTLQASTMEYATSFLEALASLAEYQLLQYDYLLVVDDVEKGRVEPKKYPTSELIRRKAAGEALEDDEDKDALPRGNATWTGIPNNELVVGPRPNKEQLTASVTTTKTTLGHSAVVEARDHAYQDYKRQFEETLQVIDDEKLRLTVAEQRWLDSWNTSVDKVKMLY